MHAQWNYCTKYVCSAILINFNHYFIQDSVLMHFYFIQVMSEKKNASENHSEKLRNKAAENFFMRNIIWECAQKHNKNELNNKLKFNYNFHIKC